MSSADGEPLAESAAAKREVDEPPAVRGTKTTPPTTGGVRNKRVYFDVETKMHTLSRIDNGEAKSAIIREMRLPPSTLATWIKDRERIAELYRHSLGRRKRLRRQSLCPNETVSNNAAAADANDADDADGAGDASSTTVVEVDPATAEPHLGGPFITPSNVCCSTTSPPTSGAASTVGAADGSSCKNAANDEEATEHAEMLDNDCGEENCQDDSDNSETPQQQQQLQQLQLPLPPPQALPTQIAIPLMRRPPQVVLPRPLVARAALQPQQLLPPTPQPPPPPPLPSPQQQHQQQHQQQQQLQQQQHSVTLGLRQPTAMQPQPLTNLPAVSLGAFLTAGVATHHHAQIPQQPPPPPHLQEPPLTRATVEELFQRYVAQTSAILTFTISPLHSSLEQMAHTLAELKQQLQEGKERRAEARARWDWLEHTRPHRTNPDKVLLAWDTNYELSVPVAWIHDSCDTEPDRTLGNLLRRALGQDRLRDCGQQLAEDKTFKALRHYVTFTQGPVSRDFCTRVVQHMADN